VHDHGHGHSAYADTRSNGVTFTILGSLRADLPWCVAGDEDPNSVRADARDTPQLVSMSYVVADLWHVGDVANLALTAEPERDLP